MRNKVFILLLVMLLCGCGESTDIGYISDTTPVTVNSLPKTTKYYYDINGIFVDATAFFSPVGIIRDLEVWEQVSPMYTFEYSGGDLLYITNKSVPGYKCGEFGDMFLVAKKQVVVDAFSDAILAKSDAYTYEEVGIAQVQLSAEARVEVITNAVSGYDAQDIVMYSIVETAHNGYVAVCLQDLGHLVQYVYITSEELTCSLRDDNTTLLIEETGELIKLEWCANSNYLPAMSRIPEIMP